MVTVNIYINVHFIQKLLAVRTHRHKQLNCLTRPQTRHSQYLQCATNPQTGRGEKHYISPLPLASFFLASFLTATFLSFTFLTFNPATSTNVTSAVIEQQLILSPRDEVAVSGVCRHVPNGRQTNAMSSTRHCNEMVTRSAKRGYENPRRPGAIQ